MKFIETKLKGAYIIEIDPIEDKRGFFARTWCKSEFKKMGLNSNLVQCSLSYNKKKGTLRGMHYQAVPYEEAKLVMSIKGAIYDVIVDIRPNSPTYKQWFAVVLTESNRKILYVPEGFAHGFQTLEDDTEVFYQMTEYYVPKYSRGFCWNDSEINIKWPFKQPSELSKKDSLLPCFSKKRWLKK